MLLEYSDECTTSPCINNATCLSLVDGKSYCVCTSEFKGQRCELPVDLGPRALAIPTGKSSESKRDASEWLNRLPEDASSKDKPTSQESISTAGLLEGVGASKSAVVEEVTPTTTIKNSIVMNRTATLIYTPTTTKPTTGAPPTPTTPTTSARPTTTRTTTLIPTTTAAQTNISKSKTNLQNTGDTSAVKSLTIDPYSITNSRVQQTLKAATISYPTADTIAEMISPRVAKQLLSEQEYIPRNSEMDDQPLNNGASQSITINEPSSSIAQTPPTIPSRFPHQHSSTVDTGSQSSTIPVYPIDKPNNEFTTINPIPAYNSLMPARSFRPEDAEPSSDSESITGMKGLFRNQYPGSSEGFDQVSASSKDPLSLREMLSRRIDPSQIPYGVTDSPKELPHEVRGTVLTESYPVSKITIVGQRLDNNESDKGDIDKNVLDRKLQITTSELQLPKSVLGESNARKSFNEQRNRYEETKHPNLGTSTPVLIEVGPQKIPSKDEMLAQSVTASQGNDVENRDSNNAIETIPDAVKLSLQSDEQIKPSNMYPNINSGRTVNRESENENNYQGITEVEHPINNNKNEIKRSDDNRLKSSYPRAKGRQTISRKQLEDSLNDYGVSLTDNNGESVNQRYPDYINNNGSPRNNNDKNYDASVLKRDDNSPEKVSRQNINSNTNSEIVNQGDTNRVQESLQNSSLQLMNANSTGSYSISYILL